MVSSILFVALLYDLCRGLTILGVIGGVKRDHLLSWPPIGHELETNLILVELFPEPFRRRNEVNFFEKRLQKRSSNQCDQMLK